MVENLTAFKQQPEEVGKNSEDISRYEGKK